MEVSGQIHAQAHLHLGKEHPTRLFKKYYQIYMTKLTFIEV